MVHQVAIVGAGLAGICMAIQLEQRGMTDFVMFEKAAEVGGVWRDNTYPGAACDLVSNLYSYSFAPHDWTHNYARQPEILSYVRDRADRVRRHIEFKTEITHARFDRAARLWRLRTADGDEHAARVLVMAVGQLDRPRVPDLPGLADFTGTWFHSARWNHDHDLTGRSVAVIGNGCSAVQFVPEIAPETARLTVFQRSPKWIIPRFDRRTSTFVRTLYQRFPLTRRINRATWYLMAETIAHSPIRGGLWGRALTAIARLHLRRQIRDPELRAQLTPDYAFGCNRMILSSTYYPALTRPNVDLVTSGINRITATGVQTADGRHHHADTIIFATGFHTTRFLAPMTITGTNGDLHERWRDGAAAHLGLTVPGFPNMFTLYGPNSSTASNSVIQMLESQVRYVLGAVELIGESGILDVREKAFENSQRALQEQLATTVWNGDCRSWYKTESGRVTALWPLRATTYRRLTRRPDPADFDLTT